MKVLVFLVGVMGSFVWSLNCHAEGNLSDVKELLNDQKRAIERCDDVDIKKHGEKIKVGDNMTFDVDEECRAEAIENGKKLICSYSTANDQAIRLREVVLIINFDADGKYESLERTNNAGYLGSTVGGQRERHACDKEGNTASQLPRSFSNNN